MAYEKVTLRMKHTSIYNANLRIVPLFQIVKFLLPTCTSTTLL